MLSRLLAASAVVLVACARGRGWTLVWHDEFDCASLDTMKWAWDTGGGGWGNGEREYYTAGENARIEGGHLVLEARRERRAGYDFTSTRLKTQGKPNGAWTYGRYEARLRIPRGQGIWPAFWLLAGNCESVGWPDCGEIDVMENIGTEPRRVHGTVHGPGYSGAKGVTGAFDGGAFADDFHLYAIEWDSAAIRWYVDDSLYQTLTPRDLPGRWVYDHPFFLILNVAVGGYWPGYPDSTTIFPQTMRVDYVRVYARSK